MNPDDTAVRHVEQEKKAAAEAAAALVQTGMTVGLGTGSTVAYLLPALARRSLTIRCVATSLRTETAARALGLTVQPFGSITRFDIAIDGADQIASDGWLVKGGGAAHTREKIVTASADRFVVIADASKTVDAIHGPIPVELLGFGIAATLRRLSPTTLRDTPPSPDGGIIADYGGDVTDIAAVAALLSGTPGIIEHGLFPPRLVTDLIIARAGVIEHIER
jgi:ribose 5-phosphate isomerase A